MGKNHDYTEYIKSKMMNTYQAIINDLAGFKALESKLLEEAVRMNRKFGKSANRK